MKNVKRLLSLVLCFSLVFSTAVVARATEKCELEVCQYSCMAYPNKTVGTVKANSNGQIPKTVSAMFAGETYTANLDSEGNFVLSYPEQGHMSSFSLSFADEHGCIYNYSMSVENVLYTTQLNTTNVGPTSITAVGVPKGAKLYAEVSGVVYSSVYATDENGGNISVEYPQQATDTRISVWYQDDNGSKTYIGTCTVTIPDANENEVQKKKSSVYVDKYIYRTSGSVSVVVKNGTKGDKVTVTVASKTYVKKLTSDKETQKFSIKLKKKAQTGSKVKITLSDTQGKKKCLVQEKVYYGDKITVGMSSKNALHTTWGPPIRKNKYGTAFDQWVFKYGKTTLYVYVKKGKVFKIQKLKS